MPDDYYKILGVPQNASPEQVKNAYRDMALKYHPDKNHDADATKRMQEINIAYATLSNPDARKQYDLLYATTFSQTKQSSMPIQTKMLLPTRSILNRRGKICLIIFKGIISTELIVQNMETCESRSGWAYNS